MDLRAVKAAGRTQLSACAMAAARNAMGLLRDAKMLAGAGSGARAYSLPALAVEECGKAGCLLIAVLSFDLPGLAVKSADMPGGADRGCPERARGPGGPPQAEGPVRGHGPRRPDPREITGAEVTGQLARARQAAASISPLLEPEAEARIADPPTEVVEFACALVSALTQAGSARTPGITERDSSWEVGQSNNRNRRLEST